MLPKIEIRRFKEKFNNISSLFMKQRSLKSGNFQNGRFLKKKINTGTSLGKLGLQNLTTRVSQASAGLTKMFHDSSYSKFQINITAPYEYESLSKLFHHVTKD